MKKLFLIPTIITIGFTPIMSLCSCNNNHAIFEEDSWENVCKYANQGIDALRNYYQVDSFVGKTKDIYITRYDGSVYKHTLTVIDEDKDPIEDAGRNAALTLQFNNVLGGNTVGRTYFIPLHANESASWNVSNLKSGVNYSLTDFYSMPEEIKQNVKIVLKKSFNETGTDIEINKEKYFLPSVGEIYGNSLEHEWFEDYEAGDIVKTETTNPEKYLLEGEQYAYYKSHPVTDSGDENESVIRTTLPLVDADLKQRRQSYWLRTKQYGTTYSPTDGHLLQYYFIDSLGKLNRDDFYGPVQLDRCLVPMFCI